MGKFSFIDDQYCATRGPCFVEYLYITIDRKKSLPCHKGHILVSATCVLIEDYGPLIELKQFTSKNAWH